MSRTFHNKKLKRWLKNRTGYASSCKHGGDCPRCVGNRTFDRMNDRFVRKYGIKSRIILTEEY